MRTGLSMITTLCLVGSCPAGWGSSEQAEALAFFETRIRPLLSENCFKCHGSGKQKAQLRMDSREHILRGGESGAAMIPGKPGESLLIEAVSYRSADLQMPPKKKLGKRQVEDLGRWIAMGAPWPEEQVGRERPVASGPSEAFEISKEDRAYWAFQPLRGRNGGNLDDMIEANLAELKLVANPPASRAVLIRRAYYALIGLPPSFEEIQAFVRDPDPQAFRKLVDRLLARPEYGERWGRHWLDVVRFAQSNGYERDDEKPHAWRYRDYVIDSFNKDKPYDRFILEQIAGDELKDGGNEGWIATGFYRLGVWDDEPDDKRAADFDGQDDILKTTTETFLGLTVGCARCHDHMFDPISQRDYYEMLAFFRNVKPYNKPGGDTVRRTGAGEALVVTEYGSKPIDTHLLIRGNAGRPGDKVEPRFPDILGGGVPEVSPTPHSAGRRQAFARWVADEKNPLTSRVMVNRLWHGHFGRGIVATPNDFGKAGQRPSNAELLDWLASEFQAGGWSIKHMHRVIMNSRAWQRSSESHAANHAIDPGNLHHWRANLRRLESEAIRDAVLQSAGVLNPERGGRGFFPPVAGEVVAGASRPGRNWEWSPREQQRRRSVYVFVKRTMLYPLFEIFDYTNTEGSLGVRPTTTVAPQALLLLNSEFVAENAAILAEKAGAQPDPVSAAFRMVLGRNPSGEERELAESFLADQEDRQVALTRRVTFRPDYPPALYGDYQKVLPAARFLRSPEKGWSHFKGKWTGSYEGIVNAVRDWPAFALYQVSARDVKVTGRFLLDDSTEQAAILLRATPREEVFGGYSVLLGRTGGEIAIRRHEGGKIAILARETGLDLKSALELVIELKGGEITVRHGSGSVLAARDDRSIEEVGRVGFSTWGGALSVDGLTIEANGQTYPVAEIDHDLSEFARPAGEAARAVPEGWAAYGGQWSVVGRNGISVDRQKGPKLLWDAVGPLGDGDSLKGEIRIADGSIGGFLLNVREPRVGADNWIGYEVSFYLDEGKLVLGTHENNWKPRARVAAPLRRGQWHWMEVRTKGDRVQVFLDNRPEPYLDHRMDQPLAPGLVGLRSWGAQVDYRNLQVSKGGKVTKWLAPEDPELTKTGDRLVLSGQGKTARRRALEEFCSLLLNLNEFVYID